MFKIDSTDLSKVRHLAKRAPTVRVSNRAHVLYMRHRGVTIIEIADFMDITPRTVINICTNYEEQGLEGALNDDPRPGRPPSFDSRTKAQIVAKVCSDPPEGFDRWSLVLLKASVEEGIVESIGKETLRMILREHDLKPWQQKMWCIPEVTEEFIERMEDVLDVYEMEVDRAYPVVCMDEKVVFLHEDIRAPERMKVGTAKRVDCEYKRNGSVNVFHAVEPKTGRYFTQVTDRRCGARFAEFLGRIECQYESAKKIVLVMDNLSTHKKKSLTDFYGEQDGEKLWERFQIHYTPKHGSWLNQAEIAIGMYQRQCLGNSRVPDIKSLKKKTAAWTRCINSRNVKINWKFTSKKAQKKFHYT